MEVQYCTVLYCTVRQAKGGRGCGREADKTEGALWRAPKQKHATNAGRKAREGGRSKKRGQGGPLLRRQCCSSEQETNTRRAQPCPVTVAEMQCDIPSRSLSQLRYWNWNWNWNNSLLHRTVAITNTFRIRAKQLSSRMCRAVPFVAFCVGRFCCFCCFCC